MGIEQALQAAAPFSVLFLPLQLCNKFSVFQELPRVELQVSKDEAQRGMDWRHTSLWLVLPFLASLPALLSLFSDGSCDL